MRIGFWNVNKKSFVADIVELVYKKELDILILAECTLSNQKLETELMNKYPGRLYKGIQIDNPKFRVITRLNASHITNYDNEYGGNSWTINKFIIPSIVSFSIIAVHFPSKLYWDDFSQSMEAVNLMNQIRNFEHKNGRNTILIGDFNMNPYEPGMISSLGLHGMKDINIAKEIKRNVQGKIYDYFYNPMWNFLGDKNEIPGTYYYKKAVHNNVMWNTFDQVLLRSGFLEKFSLSDIEIVTKIGFKNLTDPRTNRMKGDYDHLPLLIDLNV